MARHGSAQSPPIKSYRIGEVRPGQLRMYHNLILFAVTGFMRSRGIPKWPTPELPSSLSVEGRAGQEKGTASPGAF